MKHRYLSTFTRFGLLVSMTLNAVTVTGQTKDAWLITGKASGSDGAALSNSRVSAVQLTSAGIAGAPPVVTQGNAVRGQTSADGSFQINGNGLGDFVLCVQSPNISYLDPCHWSATPKVVSIRAGGTQAAVQVTAEKGATVKCGLMTRLLA